MKKCFPASLFSLIMLWCMALVLNTGCANIIPPGGGPIDSFPPVLLSAIPKDSATGFTGNKIVLNFNEYVDLQNTFENVVVSPLPKNAPIITNNFRTVSVKIKDTLEPNTTYAINFGNAIRDINEGNVMKNFTYAFSTGNKLDGNTLSGKVVLAETGRIDSTLIVVLHRNADDSAVAKERPRYLAHLDGKGMFKFSYLPSGSFALYAIPNDYSRHYDDSTKPFAFADSLIKTSDSGFVALYAYTLPKIDTARKASTNNTNDKKAKEEKEKKLRIQPVMFGGKQDVLTNLEIGFNKRIKTIDTTRIILTDTNNRRMTDYAVIADTTGNRFMIAAKWPFATAYKLIVDSTALVDSTGQSLSRNDTLVFMTKKSEDYGSIRLRFANIDLTKNPVLQLVLGDKIIESVPLLQKEWYRKLFNPGEYDLRILYDKNKNGIWDPGHFFGLHRQPEIVITLDTKLSVRANWDNEKDITLIGN